MTPSVFNLQLLYHYKLKWTIQGVLQKAGFLPMSKMSQNIEFDNDLRKGRCTLIRTDTVKTYIWKDSYLIGQKEVKTEQW